MGSRLIASGNILKIALILGALSPKTHSAKGVTLIWDPNTETDLAGYKMYYGPSSRNYTNVTDVGNVTTNTILGLIDGVTYYFAVTAYNTSGLESDFSNEINYTPATTNQVNVPPTLDPLSDLVINEDAGPQTVTLTGISSGSTNEVQTLTVTAASSNPALIPNPTVTYTSPNTTGTLSFAPLTNANGATIITVTVDDGAGTNNLLAQSFTVTVNPVNDPPTLDPINDLVLNANAGPQTILLTGISSGAPNEIQTLTITAASSNPALIPNPTITYTSPNTSGTLVFTPATNASGTSIITVTVDDGAGMNNLLAQSFTVTVNPLNTPPLISLIPAQTIQKNTSTPPLPFTIADAETPAANLLLSGASSNTNLVPASQIAFGGTDSNRTVTVTPLRGKTGTASITISVSDGVLQAGTVFLLTVLGNGSVTITLNQTSTTTQSTASPIAGSPTFVTIEWDSIPGSTYRVLYKNALDDPAWTAASGDIIAADWTTSWTDQIGQGMSSRYYCVLLVQ